MVKNLFVKFFINFDVQNVKQQRNILKYNWYYVNDKCNN